MCCYTYRMLSKYEFVLYVKSQKMSLFYMSNCLIWFSKFNFVAIDIFFFSFECCILYSTWMIQKTTRAHQMECKRRLRLFRLHSLHVVCINMERCMYIWSLVNDHGRFNKCYSKFGTFISKLQSCYKYIWMDTQRLNFTEFKMANQMIE